MLFGLCWHNAIVNQVVSILCNIVISDNTGCCAELYDKLCSYDKQCEKDYFLMSNNTHVCNVSSIQAFPFQCVKQLAHFLSGAQSFFPLMLFGQAKPQKCVFLEL